MRSSLATENAREKKKLNSHTQNATGRQANVLLTGI